jgi:FkbM family methyltransferase
MVDVGANYGYFSLLWAAQKPGNRVIAFEASPRNQQALQLNVERNGFTGAIALRSEAAGKEPGELKFHLGPEEQTGWGGLVQGNTNGDEVTVPVVRLDEDLKDVPYIDVLKIDTEGADTWVLEGATGLLEQKRIGRIFFEENTNRMAALGIKKGLAVDVLSKHGYSVEALDGEEAGGLTEYSAVLT